MANLLLFAFCLIIFLVVFIYSKRSFCAPRLFFSLSFMLSSFLFFLNTGKWHYVISDGTFLFIVASVIVFLSGSILLGKKEKSRVIVHNNVRIGTIAFILFGLIEIAGIAFQVLNYLSVLRYSVTGDFSALREYDVELPYEIYLKFLTPSITGIALFGIADLFNRCGRKNGRRNIKRFIRPIILLIGFFIYCALSSSRIEIIYLFVYFFVFYNLALKNDRRPILNPRLVLVLSIGAALLIATFFGLGFLTGKSQKQESVFDNISIYACSSIGALDCYMNEHFKYDISNMFTQTMKGVYNFLPYLGITKELDVSGEVNFVQVGDMSHATNIYTCLRTPLHDFNYFGSLIFIFIEALIYNAIYKKARRAKKVTDVSFVLYLYVAPFILMSAVSERFCTSFLTITTIVFILFMIVARRLVIKKPRIRVRAK